MREFKCASLGNKCKWKYIAKTEERLADVAAVHLRDVHGIASLNAEMVGKIKNAFTNPSPVEAKEAENLELKEILCKDLGFTCGWKYIAQTEELLVDGVAVHAREAHGIKEFTSEMATKVKQLAHKWNG
jgi:predicted small metal-binding protein